MPQDYGNWEYESDLSGYGNLTAHAWWNAELNGSVRIAQSEGLHIMECDRGLWQVDISIGNGPVDETHCFNSEQAALQAIPNLLQNNSLL